MSMEYITTKAVQDKIQEIKRQCEEAVGRVPRPKQSGMVPTSMVKWERYHRTCMTASEPYKNAIEEILRTSPLPSFIVTDSIPDSLIMAVLGERNTVAFTSNGRIVDVFNDQLKQV